MAEADIGIVFNEDRDIVVAHADESLGAALHIFDQDWHGIRSATACLPGGKLGISHRRELTGEEFRHIEGLIFKYEFKAICFQGYSEKADALAEALHKAFGTDLRLTVVTHVTTSQFEHSFEMSMLKRIHEKVDKGIFTRAGSVKPNFHLFHDKTWPKCIVNIPPNLSRLIFAQPERLPGVVFIPVENTWRKNLYTQVIAAHGSAMTERIMLVNWPSHLDQLMNLDKLQVIGFQPLWGLLSYMGMSEAVLNASLSESQPMTQLEALAVGTPGVTGPLWLPGFSDHPLGKLCEVTELDDPGLLRRRLEVILGERRADPAGMSAMIADFVTLRTGASLASYREFLEL